MRPPTSADRDRLADLMLDAYRGTIDDEGETIVEARDEVDSWFAAAPLAGHSRVLADGDELLAAVLVGRLRDGLPMVAYAMTRASRKGEGLASALVAQVVASLAAAGEPEVVAFITRGNGPSETVFTRAGFVRLPTASGSAGGTG